MSTVHVVWTESRDGNQEIYYRRAGNWGLNWTPSVRLTNNSDASITPTVCVNGVNVYVVWCDTRDGNQEIYFKRSTDEGITWSQDTRLTNDPAFSVLPFVSVSGSYVHVIWYDYRDGNNEVYYKRSTNNGINWTEDTRLTNDPNDSHDPYIASSGSNVHVVWHDNRFGNYEILHKMSRDNGSTWPTDDDRLTNAPSASAVATIVPSGNYSHVVWQDNRDGNLEIYYKYNPIGNITGITNINSGLPEEFKLEQNYPNPFNPETTIKFEIPQSSFTKLVIYNVLGKEIEELVNMELNAGSYEVTWDAFNYPSGTYFYKLSAISGSENYSETKRMVLIK
jgi:hypothetical protein